MTPDPTATIVVVRRDRWSRALESLHALLAHTDPRHPVVVVDARAPRAVGAAFDRLAAVGRIRVVRRPGFLPGNEARNLGADGVRTDWVAFLENDVIVSDGWLDALLAVGERVGAASAYPAYLDTAGPVPRVHGLGADLEITGPEGARLLRERQHEGARPWSELAGTLEPVSRVQGEPHAIVMRREFLDAMGGFDEGLLGWFDHTDVALHHLRLGAESWVVPHVTCVYHQPPPVSVLDLPTVSLRWGRDWFERSLRHLCATGGFALEQDEWAVHDGYRTAVRRGLLTPWRRVNALVDRAAAPLDRVVARWDDRRRAADAATLASA